MATDKKISQLPASSGINTSDISVLVDLDTSLQYSFSQLLSYLAANLSTGANITFGTGAIPSNSVGNNGDVYVKTNTGQFAQKLAGAWTVVFTIVQGVIGSTIFYGSIAPVSGTGINGDSYIQTVGGIFYQKVSGTWVAKYTMATGPVGPPGANGTNGIDGIDGKTVLNGASNPSNTLTGIDGDFYINTTTWNIFGPKAAGIWPAGVPFTSVAPSPTSLDFAQGVANPIVISGYQSSYAALYGNSPTIIILLVTINAIVALNTLIGGSGYVPPVSGSAIYPNVPLTGGTGSGALANIAVTAGAVTAVIPVNLGQGYTAGDVLSADNSDLGGSGSGFSITVASVGRQYTDFNAPQRVTDVGGSALQYFMVNDPDPSNSTITADTIRIIIK